MAYAKKITPARMARLMEIKRLFQEEKYTSRKVYPVITKKYRIGREMVKNDIVLVNKMIEEELQVQREAELKALEDAAQTTAYKLALEVAHKRELLYQIATGEMKYNRVVATSEGFKNVPTEPDLKERLQAITIDNLLAGHNKPFKYAETDTEGNERQSMSDAQFNIFIKEMTNIVDKQ